MKEIEAQRNSGECFVELGPQTYVKDGEQVRETNVPRPGEVRDPTKERHLSEGPLNLVKERDSHPEHKWEKVRPVDPGCSAEIERIIMRTDRGPEIGADVVETQEKGADPEKHLALLK